MHRRRATSAAKRSSDSTAAPPSDKSRRDGAAKRAKGAEAGRLAETGAWGQGLPLRLAVHEAELATRVASCVCRGGCALGAQSVSERGQLYEEMWRREFYVTGGGNFGGDFLLYPGATPCLPSIHHAHNALLPAA